MDQWEYMEEEPPRFRHSADMEAWLNERGSAGWQLVFMTDDLISAVFMKKVVQS